MEKVKKNENMIKVTYVKSCIGYDKRQAKILEGLGLTKLGQSKVLPDNACIQGSIFKVKHLVKVEKA